MVRSLPLPVSNRLSSVEVPNDSNPNRCICISLAWRVFVRVLSPNTLHGALVNFENDAPAFLTVEIPCFISQQLLPPTPVGRGFL